MNWRDVVGYDGMYQVSDTGVVKSIARSIMRRNGAVQTIRERILKTGKNGQSQHLHVALSKGGKIRTKGVHVLVAEAFIPNSDRKPEVNHKDLDPTNNCVSNLEWATKSEQAHHAIGFGVWPNNQAERNGMAKFSNIQIGEIRTRHLAMESSRSIAASFGVEKRTIERILTGKTYTSVMQDLREAEMCVRRAMEMQYSREAVAAAKGSHAL